jgi:DNA-binding response OmpR family regulator
MTHTGNRQILLIEDDPEIPEMLNMHFPDLGYHLETALDGESGLQKALLNEYDLVILDLMLPKLDGFEVCRRLREDKKGLPVLMLSARSEELDKVLGLELGADDYLTKPFSIRELLARIKAIFRRLEVSKQEVSDETASNKLVRGDLQIDVDKRKVVLEGKNVELTAKEFDLLALFAAHPGRSYNRNQLLNQVWGWQFSGYEYTVNSHINRLRGKIEKDPSKPHYIRTVWGFGYRFVDEDELDA